MGIRVAEPYQLTQPPLRPAVFFDRDGVLNAALVKNGLPHPPETTDDIAFDPDAKAVVAEIKQDGFVTICVTNQPDVARGTLALATANSINLLVAMHVGLDDLVSCFHDERDRCECRKPKPGMIFSSAKKWGIDLTRSFMIGDRWRDVDAGKSAGCQTILLNRGWPERAPSQPPDAVVRTLREAARFILSGTS